MMKFHTKKSSILLVLMLVLMTSSCVGTGKIKSMQEIPSNPLLTAPPVGKSLIIFFRPADNLSKMQADLLNVTGGNVKLVGILASGTKVAYVIDPGHYLFMSAGFGISTEFMSADLQANYIYYVLVKSWTNGFGAARYYFNPVRNVGQLSENLKEKLKNIRLVEKSAESEQWLIDNIPNLLERVAKYDQSAHAIPITHLLESDGLRGK